MSLSLLPLHGHMFPCRLHKRYNIFTPVLEVSSPVENYFWPQSTRCYDQCTIQLIPIRFNGWVITEWLARRSALLPFCDISTGERHASIKKGKRYIWIGAFEVPSHGLMAGLRCTASPGLAWRIPNDKWIGRARSGKPCILIIQLSAVITRLNLSRYHSR